MAHDEAAVRQSLEEAWEKPGEYRAFCEAVAAGERRIGGDAGSGRLAAEIGAEDVEGERLRSVQPFRAARAPALPCPGFRRHPRHRFEQSLPHLRKQVDVLMPVDEIGQVAEGAGEGMNLRGDLELERVTVEPARERLELHRLHRRKAAVAHRLKARA